MKADFYSVDNYIAGLMFQNKREVEKAHFEKIDKQAPLESPERDARRREPDGQEEKPANGEARSSGPHEFNLMNPILQDENTSSSISFETTVHDIYYPEFSSGEIPEQNVR